MTLIRCPAVGATAFDPHESADSQSPVERGTGTNPPVTATLSRRTRKS
jgi:hypothetical protein